MLSGTRSVRSGVPNTTTSEMLPSLGGVKILGVSPGIPGGSFALTLFRRNWILEQQNLCRKFRIIRSRETHGDEMSALL